MESSKKGKTGEEIKGRADKGGKDEEEPRVCHRVLGVTWSEAAADAIAEGACSSYNPARNHVTAGKNGPVTPSHTPKKKNTTRFIIRASVVQTKVGAISIRRRSGL